MISLYTRSRDLRLFVTDDCLIYCKEMGRVSTRIEMRQMRDQNGGI